MKVSTKRIKRMFQCEAHCSISDWLGEGLETNCQINRPQENLLRTEQLKLTLV